jgi:uncharacterized protein
MPWGMDLPQQAGTLLRRARHLARLTQEELAEVAAVRQSTVSEYERGRREPSLSTLRRLVRAAGYDLVLSLDEPVCGPPLTGLRGVRVREQRDRLTAELAEVGLVRPRVVGRVALSAERWHDPVEILVDPGPDVADSAPWVHGILSAYLGCDVLVHRSDELDPGTAAAMDAQAVHLAGTGAGDVGRPVTGTTDPGTTDPGTTDPGTT